MKHSIIFAAIIALALTGQHVNAGSISDPAYATGDPLTATKMNNIRTAVNDNDNKSSNNTTAIGVNSAAIGINTPKIGANTTAIGVNSTAIGINTPKIGANTTAIGVNSTAIGINTPKIGANTTAITNNTSDIAGNAASIVTKQNRVTGTCPTGQSIRVINSNGTVTCESHTDTDTDTFSAVKTVEHSGGTQITSTSSNLLSLTVTLPAAGNVIVYASGSVHLAVTSASAQLIRVKVSKTSADTSESPGIQFIRSPNISAGTAHGLPFSIVKVFSETAGTKTYFFNVLHQVGSGTATAKSDDTTLTALYVPATLP